MKDNTKANILAFLTVLLWGSGFPFTRAIGGEISPYSLVFIRCFLAAFCLVIIGLKVGIRKPFERKHLLWFFFTGLCGFSLYSVCYNLGLETLDSAAASVVSATCPIFTAILALIVYKEKINILGWVSMLTAFAGVIVLMMWDNGVSIAIGAVYILIMSVLFAAYSIAARKLSDIGYTAFETVTYSACFAAIESVFFLPGAVNDMLHASAAANLSAVYLGAFTCGLAYYLWGKALTLTDNTTRVANFIYLNPLIATIIAVIMLNEIPSLSTIIGGVIIVASVILFGIKGTK